MARAPAKSPAQVFIQDTPTGTLQQLSVHTSSDKLKQWEYSNKDSKDVVRITRNPETDRLDIQVPPSFTGKIKIPMRDILDNTIPGAHETLVFNQGKLKPPARKEIKSAEISQVGNITSTSLDLSGLGTLKPNFTPSPFNSQASRAFRTGRGAGRL